MVRRNVRVGAAQDIILQEPIVVDSTQDREIFQLGASVKYVVNDALEKVSLHNERNTAPSSG